MGTPGRRPDLTSLLVVALVAVNLRHVIAASAPLLPEIRAGLDLSEVEAGALTTLPVLCFAFIAPIASALARRFAPERVILIGLVLVTAATFVRPLGGTGLLLAGTLVIGAGITLGNVVIPAIVKRDLPHRAVAATATLTGGMCVGAALAAGLTPVLAESFGWRWALSLWGVLSFAALLVWALVMRRRTVPDVPGIPDVPVRRGGVRLLLRHPVAWAVALYLAAQSWNYFSLTAWLPTYLHDRVGLTAGAGGAAMSVYQLLGIVGSVALAPLVRLRRNQVAVAAGVSSCWLLVVLALMLAPSLWPVWTVIGGVTHGAGITMAMTLIVLRAGDERCAELLSGMVQFIGYGVGAVAPIVLGVVLARTGSWTPPLALLAVAAVVMLLAGLVAGRGKTVDI
jgi:CP family cyanate transporter-like MFS transporter